MEQKSIQFLMNLQQHCKQSQIFYEDTDKFLEYFLAKKEAETEKKNYVLSANAPAMQIDIGGFKLNFNAETVAALIAANQQEPEPISVTATPTAEHNEENKSKFLEGVSAVPAQAAAEKCQTMSSSQQKGDENDMKYVTKRSDGRCQASKVINGKRYFFYGKTKAEAQNKLRVFLGRKEREPKCDSFYNFALWWLENCKKNSIASSTLKVYTQLINTHLRINTPINKLTVLQLQEILGKLPGTRIREEVYKLIRPIIRKAYEMDLIKKDISQFIVVGKIQRTEKRALTIAEQQKLLPALMEKSDMFARRTLFYLCTGARPSEIATVNKDELKPGWVKLNGTKTVGATRWVKISPKIYELVAGESKEFFNFTNKRYREHLQDFCKSVGIEYDVDVYTLRHTFATNLYILRVPEKDRQVYMGHAAGSRITNEVYTTFTPDVKPIDIYNIYGDYLPKF